MVSRAPREHSPNPPPGYHPKLTATTPLAVLYAEEALVAIDKRYYRPAEVDHLEGDPRKA